MNGEKKRNLIWRIGEKEFSGEGGEEKGERKWNTIDISTRYIGKINKKNKYLAKWLKMIKSNSALELQVKFIWFVWIFIYHLFNGNKQNQLVFILFNSLSS